MGKSQLYIILLRAWHLEVICALSNFPLRVNKHIVICRFWYRKHDVPFCINHSHTRNGVTIAAVCGICVYYISRTGSERGRNGKYVVVCTVSNNRFTKKFHVQTDCIIASDAIKKHG